MFPGSGHGGQNDCAASRRTSGELRGSVTNTPELGGESIGRAVENAISGPALGIEKTRDRDSRAPTCGLARALDAVRDRGTVFALREGLAGPAFRNSTTGSPA